MRNKLAKIILSIIAIFGLTTAITLPTYAANICDMPNLAEDVYKANGCNGQTTTTAQTVIVNIINSVVLVLGIVAVIFIVKGGITYMTSSGDSGKLQQAKNTILYAVIGLIVCALAFIIVNFAVDIINKNVSGGSGQGTEQNSSQTNEATN